MATTYISRTTGTPTDNQKCTVSFWWKNSEAHPLNSGSDRVIFGTETTAASYIYLRKTAELSVWQASTGTFDYRTTRLVVDSGAWYHICYTIDTTLASSGDRVKVYINGVRETAFNAESAMAQDSAVRWNEASKVIYIGGGFNQNMSGLLSHFHFVDGTAYDASTFGETDSTSGIWKINTSPTVTYGNNGFFLKFEDRTNLDLDSSPNAHTFTTTGNLTATDDTPSNNYATFNPLTVDAGGAKTYTNGNNTVTETANSWTSAHSTLQATTGKYYWECKLVSFSGGSASYVGAASAQEIQENSSLTYWIGSGNGSIGYYSSDGKVAKGGSDAAFGNTWGAGDIIGMAIDLDNNFAYWSINGTWQNSGDPTSGASGTGGVSLPSGMDGGELIGFSVSPNESVMSANFGNGYFGTTAISSEGTNASGNGTFEYDVPAGYTALCTKGISS